MTLITENLELQQTSLTHTRMQTASTFFVGPGRSSAHLSPSLRATADSDSSDAVAAVDAVAAQENSDDARLQSGHSRSYNGCESDCFGSADAVAAPNSAG